MINTTQTTTYNLSLTGEQFEDLYELLDETISNISDNLKYTDLELSDYQIYHIWQQFNRVREAN